MTTVAFRDGVMSADSRGTHSDAGIMKCTKLFRKTFKATPRAKPREHLLGICGDVYAAMVFVNWYGSGKPRTDIFDYFHESEEFGILIWTGRKLYEANRLCTLIEVEDKFHAVGSGAAYALGAMACGKSAPEAVRIACRYDGYSGLPVVSVRLKGPQVDQRVTNGV